MTEETTPAPQLYDFSKMPLSIEQEIHGALTRIEALLTELVKLKTPVVVMGAEETKVAVKTREEQIAALANKVGTRRK